MIKYFCDICGKELRVADRIKILTDLDFVNAQSLITGLSLVSATALVCFDCYSQIQSKYERYLNECRKAHKIV